MNNNSLHQIDIESTPDFFKQLKEDVAQFMREGKTIEAFLKNELGITNIMDYEFSDLKDKELSDFSFNRVRGNTRLMEGQIRTFKESEALRDEAGKLDFSKLRI